MARFAETAMTPFPTLARRVGVSAVLVTAAALVAATPAAAAVAAPINCTTHLYDTGNGAHCSSGSGQYRATVRCDVNNGFDYNRYGSWVRAGQWSWADCNSGDEPFNPGLQAR